MPRIDEAELFQRKQIRGMIGVVENIAGGAENGHRAGARGGIGLLTGMQRERPEAVFRF